MEKDTQIIIKDNSLLHIYQKGQRIATAIYMITNFFDKNEPIKWQLRKISTQIIASILTFYKSGLSQRDALFMEISTEMTELRSLFDIAYYSGFISMMNYKLVSGQIDYLFNQINEYQGQMLSSNKTLFNKEFFGENKRQEVKDIDKGQSIKDSIKDTIKDTAKDNDVKDIDKGQNKKTRGPEIKDSHRSQMIKDILIKDKQKLTIKEITDKLFQAGEIVSEKTVQRELQKMLDQDEIKKEGERRWTLYFVESSMN